MIRKAERSDLDQILVLLKNFSDFVENRKKYFKNTDYLHKFLCNIIDNHVFLVAEEGDKIVGLICGYVTPNIFNPEMTTASEVFWWVEDEYKDTFKGARLLRTYLGVCKEYADEIILTLEHNSPIKHKSLERLGFKLRENIFIMEVD